MRKHTIKFVLMLLCLFGNPFTLNIVNPNEAVAEVTKSQVSRPIKRLLQSIRLNKDEIALKSFDGQKQGKLLFGESWEGYPDEERQRFVTALHAFFTLVAFPNIRKDFEHLETIIYGEPTQAEEGIYKLRATIVVLHALKKEEIPVDFLVSGANKEWHILDFWIAPKGEDSPSFLTRLKSQQLEPLLQKDGWSGLLTAMERRVEELKKR